MGGRDALNPTSFSPPSLRPPSRSLPTAGHTIESRPEAHFFEILELENNPHELPFCCLAKPYLGPEGWGRGLVKQAILF